MPTPPMLRRAPVPRGNRNDRSPVTVLTTALLALVAIGLLILALLVVTTYGVTAIGGPTQPDMLSAGVVAPFALAIAIVFFATVALNIAAAGVRHFRQGR